MPARGRFGAAGVRQGCQLFLGRHLWSFARIKANEYDFVVAAGVEGEHLQRADHTLLNLIAEHGTAVINRRKQHGVATEIVAQPNVATRLISKIDVQGELRIKLRLEADVLKLDGQARGRFTYVIRNSLRARGDGEREQRANSDDGTNTVHRLFILLFGRGRGRSRQTFLGDNLHGVFDGNLGNAAILIDPARFLIGFRIFAHLLA